MTAHVCQYKHRDAGPLNGDQPALAPVRNGYRRIIAWRCPVCLRVWSADLGGIGHRGAELFPVGAGKRRARMIEALEDRR